MKGGGGPEKVEPTEHEEALADIARQSWTRYQETGVPVQNEFIARATGLRPVEGGGYEIDPNGLLDPATGLARIDTSAAATANEAAFTAAPGEVNPNRIGALADVQRGGAVSGARAATEMGISQQSAPMQGLLNVARLGQGLQTEAVATQGELAGRAQARAYDDAQVADGRRATTGYLSGQVLGAGVGAVVGRDRSAPDAPVVPTGLLPDRNRGR